VHVATTAGVGSSKKQLVPHADAMPDTFTVQIVSRFWTDEQAPADVAAPRASRVYCALFPMHIVVPGIVGPASIPASRAPGSICPPQAPSAGRSTQNAAKNRRAERVRGVIGNLQSNKSIRERRDSSGGRDLANLSSILGWCTLHSCNVRVSVGRMAELV
jgi:hypothetical protein